MRELRIDELAESSDDDGVDAPFGRAGGESQLLSSAPSSSLEPSGSAGVTTEDRTFEDGLDESEAAYDAVYDELRCGVERYILTRAGVDASASREDRDKALDAGDFYEINKLDGDLCAGWARVPESGMPIFRSFTSGVGWWCASMEDGQMVVSEGVAEAARPVPRRTRASRAAARCERRAAAVMEEEERPLRTARASSRARGGVAWSEALALSDALDVCA